VSTTRDYYELLGIERSADETEVKRAFRKLARELHPDVSDEPDAEERFKEVVEAYEVLSNAERRQVYDRYGHEGLRSGGFTASAFDLGSISDLFSAFFGEDLLGGGRRAQRMRGAALLAEVEIELVDAARGTTVTVPFEAAVVCGTCRGSGAEPGTQPVTCPACLGAGRLQQVSRTVLGEFVRTQTCGRCGGVGRVIERPCPTCDGEGRVAERRSLDVEIPAGIHDGQRIRLTGEGHAGAPGGQAGDVYVHVHVRPDSRFVREGNDIFTTVDLTMTQAALGARLKVPTLDGEIEVEFEPGTQPGDLRVLSGLGLPVLQGRGRGDQRLLVNVAIPRRLTDEQRRQLEAFEGSVDEHTYRPDEGFFDKLKSAFR
jgi:molecular chaperone DnaJ